MELGFVPAANIAGWFTSVRDGIATFFVKMYEAIVPHGYWMMYLKGMGNTILLTIMSLFLGVIIGVLIAMIKYINQTSGKLKVLSKICNGYTTIIRGTPVMVQLLIIYYMIFKGVSGDFKILIAALSFGINSGAYVSEIIRGGINSVDKGQHETGRSLGLSQYQTMRLIIMPQAIKNILPSLFNEFIALIKETSVAGFISVMDITNAGDLVRSRTWTFHPLLVSAAMYLILVIGLTKVQTTFERRLAKGDKG